MHEYSNIFSVDIFYLDSTMTRRRIEVNSNISTRWVGSIVTGLLREEDTEICAAVPLYDIKCLNYRKPV